MYAEHRYQPRQSRSVSLGAAFLINGAILAGLIYSVPEFARKIPSSFIGTNIPIDEPPPPEPQPTEKPKVDARTPQQPPISAPDPVVATDSKTAIDTSTLIPPELPPNTQPIETGPKVVETPPAALPPLVGARRDPRYAEDFQPTYPASELRAQRDGRVSVRVLVGADGRVKAVEQVSATSPAFFDATRRQALSKWRFKPATRGGVPQESWMTLSVTFELKDQ